MPLFQRHNRSLSIYLSLKTLLLVLCFQYLHASCHQPPISRNAFSWNIRHRAKITLSFLICPSTRFSLACYKLYGDTTTNMSSTIPPSYLPFYYLHFMILCTLHSQENLDQLLQFDSHFHLVVFSPPSNSVA